MTFDSRTQGYTFPPISFPTDATTTIGTSLYEQRQLERQIEREQRQMERQMERELRQMEREQRNLARRWERTNLAAAAVTLRDMQIEMDLFDRAQDEVDRRSRRHPERRSGYQTIADRGTGNYRDFANDSLQSTLDGIFRSFDSGSNW